MKNKIIKIFGFVLIAQICLYACCGDDFNVFIASIELSALDDADNDSVSVANEDFNLQFRANYQTEMASLLSKSSGFINTANATSCDDNYAFTKRVETVTLSANVPLFGIPAGESLNTNVIVEFAFNEGNQLTMNDLLLETNNNINDFDTFLRFDTAIPTETVVTFTMTIIFENEEELINTTAAVTFE